MKLLTCVLLCAPGVLAQAPGHNPKKSKTAPGDFYSKQTAIRQSGTKALENEQRRSKADLCANAESGGQAAIGACLVSEGKVTERDYLTYIRSIGALLRLPDPESAKSKSQTIRLPFDKAEDAWQTYREQSCTSMATQWDGGDQAPVAFANCKLTLTWNHMKELADLYSDLWH
jgi:uncharacterized protein YecT (DUF1311 family)